MLLKCKDNHLEELLDERSKTRSGRSKAKGTGRCETPSLEIHSQEFYFQVLLSTATPVTKHSLPSRERTSCPRHPHTLMRVAELWSRLKKGGGRRKSLQAQHGPPSRPSSASCRDAC